MKKAIINELISIADYLDESGFSVQADKMDEIIKSAGTNSHSVMSFADALKQEISRTDKDLSVNDIIVVIDKLLEMGSFQEPSENSENWKIFKDLDNKGLQLADSIMNLEDDIKKADDWARQTDDPQEQQNIMQGKEEDIDRLQKRIEQLDRMRSGGGREGDLEVAEKAISILKDRGRM